MYCVAESAERVGTYMGSQTPALVDFPTLPRGDAREHGGFLERSHRVENNPPRGLRFLHAREHVREMIRATEAYRDELRLATELARHRRKKKRQVVTIADRESVPRHLLDQPLWIFYPFNGHRIVHVANALRDEVSNREDLRQVVLADQSARAVFDRAAHKQRPLASVPEAQATHRTDRRLRSAEGPEPRRRRVADAGLRAMVGTVVQRRQVECRSALELSELTEPRRRTEPYVGRAERTGVRRGAEGEHGLESEPTCALEADAKNVRLRVSCGQKAASVVLDLMPPEKNPRFRVALPVGPNPLHPPQRVLWAVWLVREVAPHQ